jgi:HEAT repeat protein
MDKRFFPTERLMRKLGISLLVLAVLLACAPPRALGYVDLAPTLARILNESQGIVLVEVDKFSRDNGAVILKKVRDLKGQASADPIKHHLAAEDATMPGHILEWCDPGRRAVMFVASNSAMVCLGQSWYQVHAVADGWWTLGANRPDLPLSYCGTVSRLTDAVEQMLAGKTAVITTVPHGADDEAASFDLALNRTNQPGLLRLQRLRANLRMPPMVMAASANPAFLVGPGPAGEEEIPSLIEKLKSPDATERAESADDLRTLGPKAKAAAATLAKLLDDPSAWVRMSAAAALLRINQQDTRPVEVLAKALASPETLVRRHAARAAGLTGPAAAPLAVKLAGLLADSDELTRRAALQSIGALGPSAAAARDAVVKLLDDPQTAADAADTLGRMGSAARPALKRLAAMLSAEPVALRWAAVRAMSQIGGEDAVPAVDFMIREMPKASDVDRYNMMIYLGVLGPVAKDAIPAIQSSRVAQRALISAALWAIEPDKRFPWLGANYGGMPQEADVVRFIYQAFFTELGDHLRPASRVLAQKIMDGSAGDVPSWGYKLLARFPDEVIGILSAGLADSSIVQRERAVVALGYMGPAAAPCRARVAEALRQAPTEQEQRLIKWCLKEMGGESLAAKKSP